MPAEAEWEKAARGTDGRIYPWGNDARNHNLSNSDLLNRNTNVNDTKKVGSYENGKSPYGAYDMAGNVMEWVNDWYSDIYYQTSPSSNPLGTDSGQYRVSRGGPWYYYGYLTAGIRDWNDPSVSLSLPADSREIRLMRAMSLVFVAPARHSSVFNGFVEHA